MAKAKKSPAAKKSNTIKSPLPDFVPLSIAADHSTASKWLELGDKTQQVRHSNDPCSINKELAKEAAKDPESPTSPAFNLWIADNFAMQGRHDEAIRAFDDVLKSTRRAGKLHPRINVTREALYHQAAVAAQGGKVDLAIQLWKDQMGMKERHEESMLAAARFAESAGRVEDASMFYKSITGSKTRTSYIPYAEFARRGLLRMNAKKDLFFTNYIHLKDVLVKAIEDRDGKTLEKLISSTHFSVALGGGSYRFEDDDLKAEILAELAAASATVSRSVKGVGQKRYLFMTGWNGKLLKGEVGFMLTHSARGWQWSGVIFTLPSEAMLQRWPIKKETNQPLPFSIKAPWPAGDRFTAGGLENYIIQQAAIVTASLIAWPFGAIAAASLLEYLASSDCGFGLRGFYYNSQWGHQEAEAFAIDFSRYKKYVPYDNISGGTLVLAAAPGLVYSTGWSVATGDDSMANYAEIFHPDPDNAAMPDRFLFRYLHFAGPNLVRVSAMMPVFTGQLLGYMNDTGESVIDHLHFSIHDQTLPYGGGWYSYGGDPLGKSIRPTPMDGVDLNDGDSGKCVLSSNMRYYPPPPDDADFISEQAPPHQMEPGQAVNVSVTMLNNGPTTWGPTYKLIGDGGWLVHEVPIQHTVAPGERITISFSLTALVRGDYPYRWQVERPYGGRFGDTSPSHTITVGDSSDPNSCADIANEIQGCEGRITLLQQMLQTASASMKPGINASIRAERARITALKKQQDRLGCA